MSGILLHKTLGLNARMTFCPYCLGPGEYLILAGRLNWKVECNCGTIGYGMTSRDKCTNCGQVGQWGKRIELDDYEKVPAASPCDKCREGNETANEAVRNGGIFFKCEAGCFGAVQKSDFADNLRAELKVPAPDPCGIMFSEADCPNKDNHKTK